MACTATPRAPIGSVALARQCTGTTLPTLVITLDLMVTDVNVSSLTRTNLLSSSVNVPPDRRLIDPALVLSPNEAVAVDGVQQADASAQLREPWLLRVIALCMHCLAVRPWVRES
jgi:hypothetical protein